MCVAISLVLRLPPAHAHGGENAEGGGGGGGGGGGDSLVRLRT